MNIKKALYGLSIEKSIDVTNIIKKHGIPMINVNVYFGDPYPNFEKKLIIYTYGKSIPTTIYDEYDGKLTLNENTLYNWNLSVLLTTIGRPCLQRMLDSLVNQLTENDYLYVIIDGPSYFDSAKKILHMTKFTEKWKCSVIIHEHPINVGFWGHELKNQYQQNMKGDYIMYADDDDIYETGAFKKIRSTIKQPDQLYIFQMYRPFFNKKIIPEHDEISTGNIGSPCGVVANRPHLLSRWENHYDGDSQFWKETSKKFEPHQIHFIHKIIYHVIGEHGGHELPYYQTHETF